ncbi:MAG: hypothetical protein IPL65_14790 [Lewinellaceae bacterium]|nr:hypothetical protein [Lewinellaceae bacterium]
MKKSMQLLFAASLIISGGFFASCGGGDHAHNANATTETTDANHMTSAEYACPMHPEITGHEGDKCSKCGMPLEKVVTADYACPMHPEITGHEGDKCSKCGMPLEKVATADYACPMHPDITGKEGDSCSKCGMALTPVKK